MVSGDFIRFFYVFPYPFFPSPIGVFHAIGGGDVALEKGGSPGEPPFSSSFPLSA